MDVRDSVTVDSDCGGGDSGESASSSGLALPVPTLTEVSSAIEALLVINSVCLALIDDSLPLERLSRMLCCGLKAVLAEDDVLELLVPDRA